MPVVPRICPSSRGRSPIDWKRLFRLTKLEYYTDFVLTPSITACLIWTSTPTPLWFLSVLFGFLGWLFVEYAFHRWILHTVLHPVHKLHHENQQDYIAIHPVLSLVLYLSLWGILGFGSSPVMIGYSLGYILYSIFHTMFHYTIIRPGHPLYRLKMNHATHHRKNTNFGVTSPIWDLILRTYNR